MKALGSEHSLGSGLIRLAQTRPDRGTGAQVQGAGGAIKPRTGCWPVDAINN